jgi:hypothetical protein
MGRFVPKKDKKPKASSKKKEPETFDEFMEGELYRPSKDV